MGSGSPASVDGVAAAGYPGHDHFRSHHDDPGQRARCADDVADQHRSGVAGSDDLHAPGGRDDRRRVTVPLSICGTLVGMWFLGYTIDNFSLMALTISVGFVVDDAIVMIENIVRLMERGEPPLRAAIIGARQIGFTVMSITLSLVAVFVPLIFMGGILGRLFHEFAMTLTMAILISAVVSLSLTPMICGRYLTAAPARETHGWHGGGIDAVLETARRGFTNGVSTRRCGINCRSCWSRS